MQTVPRAHRLWRYVRSPQFRWRLKHYIASPLVSFGRSIVSHLYVYALVVMIGYAGWRGWQRATVIAPFQLPPENREKPLPFSGETVADTLVDAFSAIQSEAQGLGLPPPCSQMAAKHMPFAGVVFQSSPAFEVIRRPMVEVKGISVEAAISVAREILGREQDITGDVVAVGSDQFELMARGRNLGPWNAGPFPLSLDGLESGDCTLAEEVLASTNRNLLGAALLRRAQYQRVIALYRRMPADKRERADASNNLADALTMTQDLDDAERYLNYALTLRPAFPEALLNLGGVLFQRQDLKDAEAELREAIRLRPDYAQAHFDLGVALLEDNSDLNDAKDQFLQAVWLRPDYAEAHLDLGVVLMKKQDLTGADAQLREAIGLRPDYAAAHYNLGLVLEKEGNRAGAQKEYLKALNLDPGFSETREEYEKLSKKH